MSGKLNIILECNVNKMLKIIDIVFDSGATRGKSFGAKNMKLFFLNYN